MRECWLVYCSRDGGKTWHPSDNRAQFRAQDAEKIAEYSRKETRGLYLYRTYKFIMEEAGKCRL